MYTYKICLRKVLKRRTNIRGLTRHCCWTAQEEFRLRFLSRWYILLVDSRYKGIISHLDIYLFYFMSIICCHLERIMVIVNNKLIKLIINWKYSKIAKVLFWYKHRSRLATLLAACELAWSRLATFAVVFAMFILFGFVSYAITTYG